MNKTYIRTAAAVLWLVGGMTVSAALHTGMSGPEVSALQDALTDAGYFARTADGDYGSTTAKAVSLFQEEHGLAVTGEADDETIESIRDAEGSRAGGGVVMAEGNHGADVRAAQEQLQRKGFLNEKSDGIYGPATTHAVRAFQKNRELPVSGVIDEETLAALEEEHAKDSGKSGKTRAVLKRGDRGEDVTALQKKLIRAGYLGGDADGIFGGDTESAVRAFKKERKLGNNGRADKKTMTALEKETVSSSHMKEGSRGREVARLQNLLTLHGFSTDGSDGIYGSGTAKQVRAFQDYYGLPKKTEIDEGMWEKLESAPVFLGDYKKMLHMHSTAYTPFDSGGTGHTASGNIAGKGHAAVDPSVIPLGSLIFIEGYGYALADDIGGSISGEIVDVCVDTLEQAYRWGSRGVKVYIVR